MAHRRRALIPLILILALLAAGAWSARQRGVQPQDLVAALRGQPAHLLLALLGARGQQEETLAASGYMEAEEVALSFEAGGRIVELLAGEGEAVQADQVVARLDPLLLDAQIAQAEAAVAVAEANLRLLRAGARPEEIAHARARLAQAEAAREAARQAWQDALAQRDDPQDLSLSLIGARTQLAVAQAQVEAATALAQAADLEQGLWGRAVSTLARGFDVTVPVPGGGSRVVHQDAPPEKLEEARLQWNLAGQRAWQAWQNVAQAQAARDGAQSALLHLEESEADPTPLAAQADAAEADFHAAEAAVEMARAAVQALQDGATTEELDAAQARVEQAQAAVAALRAQREKLVLRAPRAGWVTRRTAHVGEAVTAGAPVLHLADLETLTLTVFVPEDRLGQVHLGQAVQVTVDAFPGRSFPGTVKYIANRAEFTPKNVQTQAERVQMVFAVKIALENPDLLLKPGMPADALFAGKVEP
jgi:HlyD family secretion protein